MCWKSSERSCDFPTSQTEEHVSFHVAEHGSCFIHESDVQCCSKQMSLNDTMLLLEVQVCDTNKKKHGSLLHPALSRRAGAEQLYLKHTWMCITA